MNAALYDAKPYDRYYFERSPGQDKTGWRFHEFRLDAQTASTVQGARAVCVFVNDRIDESCLKLLGELGVKLVALRCAGYNNVDLAAAKSLDIAVVRVPAYSPHAVAEHAVGLLLTLNRKIHRAYNRGREHNFSLSGLVGFDVYGKSIGIVGTGKIGRIAAQVFRGFGTRVLAYDPFPSVDWATAHGVEYVDFATLLSVSDFVSLHVPLLPETFHLLNERTIAQMKPGAILINTQSRQTD